MMTKENDVKKNQLEKQELLEILEHLESLPKTYKYIAYGMITGLQAAGNVEIKLS